MLIYSGSRLPRLLLCAEKQIKALPRASQSVIPDCAGLTEPEVPEWPRVVFSCFHLEIGEGDAATGIGETVLLAPAVLFKLRFLGKRSGEAHLALCATAGPAGVIHLDSVGFRQFQEGHGLVGLDRPVALDEVDTVPRLGQRQRLRHTLASARDAVGSETLAMKLGLIKAEFLQDPPYVRGEQLGPAQEDVPVIEVGDQRMDHRLV